MSGTLQAQTLSWCGRLRARGLEAGDRVVVLSHNREELLPALFAAWRLGIVWVPLNARLPAVELAPLCERAAPKLVLAEDALVDRLPGAVSLQALAAEPGEALEDAPSLAPSVDAALLFTSGTTGAPKGARLSRGAFIAGARASLENLGLGPGGWLLCMPLFHVGGLAMALRAHLDGVPLVLLEKFEAARVHTALHQARPSFLSVVPTQLRWLLDHSEAPPPASLRAVLVGGGPAPGELLERARGCGWPVLQTYGLTEACSQVATERPGEADGSSAGPPLPGYELRIVEGEVQVRAPSLLTGYLPPHEAPFTEDGFFRTGDLGELDERGRLRVLSRRLDLIVTGGENVYPPEVEAVLSSHPEISDAAVVPVPDDTWGQAAVALWAPRNGNGAPGLAEWCRQRLAGFKVPRHFIAVPSVPRNATGKVDRARARALAESHVRQGHTRTGDVHMSSAAEMKGYLGEVEKALAAALAQGTPPGEPAGEIMLNAARHLCIGGGGKRIRPSLVLHFGKALGVAAQRLVPLGVAAELIHSASLLHDDVVDVGMFRRGRPTVNSLWGNVVAVMSGDMVLTVALQQLVPIQTRLSQDALSCVLEMTRGTIAELEARGDLEMPLEKMRLIADGKTGALFGFCGVAAARLANDDAAAVAFEEFGRRLGIAFQIADDIKDLTGLDAGKPQFADLASKTPSLPVLMAAHADGAVKRRILDAWSFGDMRADRVRELGQAVLETGVLPQAIARMKAEVAAARVALRPWEETEGGKELLNLAHLLETAFDDRGTNEGHPVDGTEAKPEQRAV